MAHTGMIQWYRLSWLHFGLAPPSRFHEHWASEQYWPENSKCSIIVINWTEIHCATDEKYARETDPEEKTCKSQPCNVESVCVQLMHSTCFSHSSRRSSGQPTCICHILRWEDCFTGTFRPQHEQMPDSFSWTCTSSYMTSVRAKCKPTEKYGSVEKKKKKNRKNEPRKKLTSSESSNLYYTQKQHTKHNTHTRTQYTYVDYTKSYLV